MPVFIPGVTVVVPVETTAGPQGGRCAGVAGGVGRLGTRDCSAPPVSVTPARSQQLSTPAVVVPMSVAPSKTDTVRPASATPIVPFTVTFGRLAVSTTTPVTASVGATVAEPGCFL